MRPQRSLHVCLAVAFVGILSSHVALACAQTRRQQQEQLVETVEVQGNRRLRDDEILTYIKSRPGEPFSMRQIQDDLERIVESGAFDKNWTRVLTELGERGGVVVIFEVFELPLISEVTFTGMELAGMQASEIVRALSENRIKLSKGDVYDSDEGRKALHVIRDLLASRGRTDVRVAIHNTIDNPTYVSIEISFTYAGQ